MLLGFRPPLKVGVLIRGGGGKLAFFWGLGGIKVCCWEILVDNCCFFVTMVDRLWDRGYTRCFHGGFLWCKVICLLRISMRNVLFSRCLRVVFCGCVLCFVAICMIGCTRGTPGETAAEVKRRHIDIVHNNMQQLQSDVDTVLMLDQPSKLSDRHIR